MTLIDLFREFSHVANVEVYPKSVRLLYYTMLWQWNEQKRPEIARLPHAQLYTLAGLPEATYREAFKYLADEGWVKRVKSRNRAVSAWIMRDRCVKTAPPAGFLMSPAQRKRQNVEEEEKPHSGFSSSTTTKSEEAHANVREHTEASNTGNDDGARGIPPEEPAEYPTNDSLHGEFEAPEFEL